MSLVIEGRKSTTNNQIASDNFKLWMTWIYPGFRKSKKEKDEMVRELLFHVVTINCPFLHVDRFRHRSSP